MKITYLSASARSVSAALWGREQNDKEKKRDREEDRFEFPVLCYEKKLLFQRRVRMCVCARVYNHVTKFWMNNLISH